MIAALALAASTVFVPPAAPTPLDVDVVDRYIRICTTYEDVDDRLKYYEREVGAENVTNLILICLAHKRGQVVGAERIVSRMRRY